MAPAESGVARIEVVYCPRPGVTDSTFLPRVEPRTVADALQASGVLQRHGLMRARCASGCGTTLASRTACCATGTVSRFTAR